MNHVKRVTRTPQVASTGLYLGKYVDFMTNLINQKASSLSG